MTAFPPAVAAALAIDRTSRAWERTIDITTIGAKSGQLRRIEIWFHRIEGRWYLSSTPARRAWYANLQADPRLTVHLKHGVQADLLAQARLVVDPDERRRAFEYIVEDLNQPHNPARVEQPQSVDEWMAGSPLVEIIFDELRSAHDPG